MSTKAPKYGMPGISNIVSSTSDKVRGTYSSPQSVISSRVRDIILDDTHPQFNQYGKWNGIGTIFIESTKNPTFSPEIPLIPAFPAFPNIKHYPLINELVPIIYLTDVDVTSNTTSVSAYYLPPINVWNSQVHNAIPSTNLLPDSQTKNYQQVEGGSTNIISTETVDINLGKTFKEQNSSNIHPLLPYEGDIIIEGRFGNSIRFGSTVNNAAIPNEWSSIGENGFPITIIRNGQSDQIETDSWVPTVENINENKSSIYLTSNQKIPIFPSSNREESYAQGSPQETPRPQSLGVYSSEQIILNSGRLVLNAKKDSIILGAEKSIHITSNTSVNIDAANQIVMAADKIYLGSARGIEGSDIQSTVKGENLNTLLGEIAGFLDVLSVALKTAVAGNLPIPSLNSIAADASTLSKSIRNTVNSKDLLSKQVKIK
jgi:hypothetical protein